MQTAKEKDEGFDEAGACRSGVEGLTSRRIMDLERWNGRGPSSLMVTAFQDAVYLPISGKHNRGTHNDSDELRAIRSSRRPERAASQNMTR